jgi:hypothetical protein
MFKLQNTKPSFKTKVDISIAGEARPASIEVEYKYMTKSQVRDFFNALEGKTDVEALGEIIVGWSGVDQAYSADTLAMLIDEYPSASTELFDTFRRELFEAKRKN